MTTKKVSSKLVGEQFLDAHARFVKKRGKDTKLIAEVNALLNRQQIWYCAVFLNITAERLKRGATR